MDLLGATSLRARAAPSVAGRAVPCSCRSPPARSHAGVTVKLRRHCRQRHSQFSDTVVGGSAAAVSEETPARPRHSNDSK